MASKKVSCYGVGGQFIEFLNCLNDDVEIIAVADRDMQKAKSVVDKESINCVPVTPDKLSEIECDYYVICSDMFAKEMKENLIRTGVDPNQIVLFSDKLFSENKPGKKLFETAIEDWWNSKDKLSDLTKKDMFTPVIINDMLNLGRKREIEGFYKTSVQDWVRVSTIELLAKQINIKNVHGDVAELGVFQGRISAILNELFPSKKLYLFDTFEGFSQQDILTEKGINSDIDYSEISLWFQRTTEELVMGKLKYPEKAVIKKGYFPDTLEGMPDDAEYCLVSIDPDLYAPTYDGIRYFFPRLCAGGYMIIHDYECPTFRGCRKAIDNACRELGLSFVPIPDENGSVVITKNYL